MKIDGTVRLLAANRKNISARDLAKTFLVKIELSIPVKHLGVVGGQCLLYDILKKNLIRVLCDHFGFFSNLRRVNLPDFPGTKTKDVEKCHRYFLRPPFRLR